MTRDRLRARLLRRARGVIANSRFTRGYLESYGIPETRTAVIHPCIDLSSFESPLDVEAFRRKEGLTGKQVLLVVARLYANKGIQRVIPLLPKIIGDFPDLMYVVAGVGPYRIELQRLAEESGVTHHVMFTGNRNIVEFFRACDVYIMTTLWNEQETYLESFGITFLEANACKKPCISGICGGMPESVEHGVSGLNVDPDDPDALVAVIKKLLGDIELRHRLGQQGYQRVKRDFTYTQFREQLAAFLNTLEVEPRP